MKMLALEINLLFFGITQKGYIFGFRLSRSKSDQLFSEDFVGRCCRQSRRVSPVAVGCRVLQRYLVMAKKAWEKPDNTKVSSQGRAKRGCSVDDSLSAEFPAKRAKECDVEQH